VFLRGTFDAGPITTVQRKGTSLFLSDFQVLQPLYATSIARELTAQLARVKPVLEAEVAKVSSEMEAERSKPFIQPDLSPDEPKGSPELNQRQPNISALAKPYAPSELESVSHQIEKERRRAKSRSHVIFPLPSPQTGTDLPPDFEAEEERGRHETQAQVLRVGRELKGAVSGSKSQVSSGVSEEFNVQSALSRNMVAAESARAQSEIQAVFRRPPVEPPVLSTDATVGLQQEAISWDAWYARFARLSNPLLLAAVKRRGSPEGANTISITVWPNHRLVAELISGGNAQFDMATVQAYSSLSGNPALAFPAGSLREQVMFFIDNQHGTPGAVSGVNSQTCKGDVEIRTRRP
jgi:hypothetical protein